ncbi:MAG: COX15/CtaA family protein [Coraliomargarita sp.]
MTLTANRNASYKPALFYFCILCLCWITLLLFAGGFTTTIRAGMAFLDWPLSNGSINPEGWTTEADKMAEHSHRLLGMKIGFLSIGLFVWTWFREGRRSVRLLARLLLLVVILQGVLGGARVRFDWLVTEAETNLAGQSFAVIHACGAMIVLGILVAITILSSRLWIEGSEKLSKGVPSGIQRWGLIATLGVFLQILVGAIMRHAEAGLAIATFPLANATSLLPSYWTFGVGIHFAHRVGAVLVTVVLMVFLTKAWNHAATRKALGFGIVLLIAALTVQLYLGALTIWTVRNPYVATIHHLVGAFLLASTWGLTFLTYTPPKPR